MKVLLVALLAMLLAFSKADRLAEAELVIEGILVGAFGPIGHEVQECIQDGELIFTDMVNAIEKLEEALKTKSKQALVEAFSYIGDALVRIPEEVRDCEAVPEIVRDIEKIAAEFLNPEALVIMIGEKILWHGISIYHDITKTVSDFKSAQYEPAGEDIGDIIRLIFLSIKADKAQEAIDFLEGFFKGALEDESVEIESCIQDVDEIVHVIEKIIADVEHDPFSHLESLFLDFIDLLADIPKSVQQCKVSESELATFTQWAQQLKDVKGMAGRFYRAFLKFPQRLRDDFRDVIDDFKSDNFNHSGFCIGDILNVIFTQVTYEDPADNAVAFVKAYFKSAFSISLQLDACKASVGSSWKDLVHAIKLIGAGSVESGVAALMKAVPELLNSFQTCKSDWPQIKEGLTKLKTFVKHPARIFVAVSEAVALNPISFPKDAYNIFSAFHATPINYDLGGQATGDITKIVLKYMPVESDTTTVATKLIK